MDTTKIHSDDDASVAYIYGIKSDKSDYFYIGSTSKEIGCRFGQHYSNARHGIHCNPRLAAKLLKFGSTPQDSKCYVECLEVTTEKLRFAKEYQWIKSCFDRGSQLLNIVHSPNQNEYIIKARQRKVAEEKLLFVQTTQNALAVYDLERKHNRSPQMLFFVRSMLQRFFNSSASLHFNFWGVEAYSTALQLVLDSGYAKEIGVITGIQKVSN